MNNPINITETACRAFLDNLQSDSSENKYIRIAVKGGRMFWFILCFRYSR